MIERFGSFAEAVAAPPARLVEVEGMTSSAAHRIQDRRGARAALRQGRDQASARSMGSWSEVIDYCRAAMAFEDSEEFRILFLDKKNGLIADEVQGVGTVDHTPVYPREVVKRALELSASAVILVHNHPSGDPTPSHAGREDDARHHRHRQAARRDGPRPHHRRPAGPRVAERDAADLAGAKLGERSGDTNSLGAILGNVSGARVGVGAVAFRHCDLTNSSASSMRKGGTYHYGLQVFLGS